MGKKKKSQPLSFTNYVFLTIDRLKNERRFGTAHVYLYTMLAFSRYIGGGEIFFGGISRSSLKRFERYLEEELCRWNTISTYIRAIRAIYNRAVDEELIPGEYRLFKGVRTSTTSEQKRALKADQMRVLMNAADEHPEMPAVVRQSGDILSLMLQLHGMPFVDLIHLRKDDLRKDVHGGNLLTCRRRKTGTELRVGVTDRAMLLIERYRSTAPNSQYLLRFLDGTATNQDAYREYCHQLRTLNHNLAKLPLCCGLQDVKVSSYTARHTWATLAKFCQVPEEVISEGLGHSSLEVTRTYLKSFEDGEPDEANKLIINYILTGVKKVWNKD